MTSLEQIWMLADLEDTIKVWAGIIFMVIYGVAHLVSSWQEEKKKARAKPRPVAPPEAAGGAAAAAQGGAKPATLEDTLRREVEDFLRRAQGQQPQQGQQAQKRQPPLQQRPAQQQRPQRPAPLSRGDSRQGSRPAEQPRPVRRLTDEPRPSSPIPVLTPVLTPVEPSRPLTTPLGAGVAQHVAEHLRGTQAVVEHAQQLGADVAQADERMQEHLHSRFAHRVGALAPATVVVSGQAVSPTAQEIRDLLSRPSGVRQLVIAGEILRRPEDRWGR